MKKINRSIDFNIGNDELRDTRIKRLEEIFNLFNLTYAREFINEIKVKYLFNELFYDDNSSKKELELRRALMCDNTTIVTICDLYEDEKDFYYNKIFKKYISDEHKITVATTKASVLSMIFPLLNGYKFVSYSKIHNFAIEYTAGEGLNDYIIEHYLEFRQIFHGYRVNFNEAYKLKCTTV